MEDDVFTGFEPPVIDYQFLSRVHRIPRRHKRSASSPALNLTAVKSGEEDEEDHRVTTYLKIGDKVSLFAESEYLGGFISTLGYVQDLCS